MSSVVTMDHMFWGTESFDGDISKWDVSRVESMHGMFLAATSFSGDLSKWDVSSVTNMESMFTYAASFNGDISKWDVSSVTNTHCGIVYRRLIEMGRVKRHQHGPDVSGCEIVQTGPVRSWPQPRHQQVDCF